MTQEEIDKIVNNPSFIDLVNEALHNNELKNDLLYALRSDDLTRTDIIKKWVGSSSKKQAPKEFIEALSFLAHKEIANETLRQLNN